FWYWRTAAGGFDFGAVDLAHLHHRVDRARGGLAVWVGDGFDQHPRRDLPGHAPLVLAPAAGGFLAAVADDGVPQAVGLFLVVGGDLEREGFGLGEGGAAVEADAGDAADGEVHHQHVALLAVGVVAGGAVDAADFAVREGLGVEAGGFLGGAIEPEADRVLGD